MPFDEEGNKWSCDPCLRGHRSSKCQHFDRLMAKVPKSGRPSKRCPHAKRNCGCRKSYAVMARLSYEPKSLCQPVYYVSHNSEEPYTPEPYSPNPLDAWHHMIESNFYPLPPHIPDVFDIMSPAPKSAADCQPPSYFPAPLDDPVSSNSHAHALPTGLGINMLSVMSNIHNDNTYFVQESQPLGDPRGVFEVRHDMNHSGQSETNYHHMTPNFPDWPSDSARAP